VTLSYGGDMPRTTRTLAQQLRALRAPAAASPALQVAAPRISERTRREYVRMELLVARAREQRRPPG
jgi:hypothetical protein